MTPESKFFIRIICAVIAAACSVAAVAIRTNMEERAQNAPPSWYSPNNPCDYRIGNQYGHLTVCDVTPSYDP